MKKETTKTEKELTYNPEITQHDKDLLNQDNANLHSDNNADQQLIDRKEKVDFTGGDLDIPGRTAAQKGNGTPALNDEENKLHSQGGDRHNNLERDDAAR
ncbi:hypothetical protein LY01_01158 [Nonlabens xylanidelens]|uniref:Uncharacterized protein n=1 Tax=Nonlabens xylanidelens TaxID=191564 RepID=A0A2S6IMV3_9FLAO|nr:hypothetical protein [Nonlabens xylanidelens]PPK95567.1 hypothetical protein LY01_01158 [Nonlabens xylanidelens]PQJ22373.1 hypothetical protein BST94_02030 [Nonlabens xylanidelens]